MPGDVEHKVPVFMNVEQNEIKISWLFPELLRLTYKERCAKIYHMIKQQKTFQRKERILLC